MNAIIPRATIEEMVAHRDRAISLYRIAFGKIAEADAALDEARAACLPFKSERRIGVTDSRSEEIAAFHNAIKMPDMAALLSFPWLTGSITTADAPQSRGTR